MAKRGSTVTADVDNRNDSGFSEPHDPLTIPEIMSRPTLSCPRCGKLVEARGPSETAVFDESRRVRSVKRSFRAECVEHGYFEDEEAVGNHVTMWDRKFNRLFPPSIRRDVLKTLSVVERLMFNEMRRGKRLTDWIWLESLVQKLYWIEISSYRQPAPVVDDGSIDPSI